MKTKNIILSGLIGLTLLTTSCDNGFDAINTNPNVPGTIDYYKSDLATALRAGATLDGADLHQRIKSINVDVFSHYLENGPGRRNYTPADSYNEAYWGAHFRWMYLLNTVIEDTKDKPELANFTALTKVWRVYIQSQATDFFGPMPFPKNTADAEFAPYEPLADQYKFFYSELKEAVALFDAPKAFMTPEDNIYFGQVDKWKRFTNSLHLRLALRVSEIDPALCKTEAQAAVSNAAGLMELNGDARIGSVTGWGNQYPYYMYQIGWGGKSVMVTSMEKVLTGIGGLAYHGPTGAIAPAKVDPRGAKYFDPSSKNKEWKGIAPGLMSNEVSNMNTDFGYMSQLWILTSDSRPMDVFLYPEVCFLMAEAVERGFVSGSGTAKDWYEKGVKASFLNWGISDADATAYLASAAKNTWGTSANYDDATGNGNTKLEKIITQKYIANYPDQAYQAWDDKRRLNLPAFDIPKYIDPGAGTYPSNSKDIKNPENFISRMTYPQSESLINNAKYLEGVAQLRDGDKTSSPLWWASKRSNYVTSVVN